MYLSTFKNSRYRVCTERKKEKKLSCHSHREPKSKIRSTPYTRAAHNYYRRKEQSNRQWHEVDVVAAAEAAVAAVDSSGPSGLLLPRHRLGVPLRLLLRQRVTLRHPCKPRSLLRWAVAGVCCRVSDRLLHRVWRSGLVRQLPIVPVRR